MKKMALAIAFATTLSGPVHSAESNSDDRTGLNLTLYQDGFAVVQDERNIPFIEGVQEIQFKGVSSNIIPDSTLLSSNSINVLERNYSYDLLSLKSLLNAHVGKPISLQLNGRYFGDSESRMIWIQDAELLATQGDHMIVKTKLLNEDLKETSDTKVLTLPISKYGDMVSFDSVPSNLSESPTLSMKVDSNNDGFDKVNLTYMTEAMDWEASYVANMVNSDTLNLDAWVTITNDTVTPFEGADIQLLAGEVNTRSKAHRNQMVRSKAMMSDAIAQGAKKPESVGGYKLFTLESPVDVEAKQKKQVSLFSANNVSLEKKYSLSTPFSSSFTEKKPDITVAFKNTSDQGLGFPMPEGSIRFYESDQSGRKQFVGETHLPDLDKHQNFESQIGKAFGVSVTNNVESWDSGQGLIEGSLSFANSSDQESSIELQLLSERVRIGSEYTDFSWCEEAPFQGGSDLEPIFDLDLKDTGVEILNTSMSDNNCTMLLKIPADKRVTVPYSS